MLVNPLIVVRDIHFASTVIVAGIIFFDLLIAAPVWREFSRSRAARSAFQGATGKILWISLALSIVSALAWLFLLSMRITHKGVDDVMTDGTVWIVLSRTQFGFAWGIRLLFGGLLAACVLLRRASQGWRLSCLMILAGLLASAYLGALAFAGHGAEGLEFAQVHLAADFLHLIAAGLWLGALLPLVLLLTYLRRFQEDGWVAAAARAGSSFSTLGILAVGILFVSGTINASFLLEGMQSLIDTPYGQLLLLKIVLFAAMLCLAGINRQHLLPRLHDNVGTDGSLPTIHRLVRNSLIEIAFGIGIVLIVGTLGVMAPANQVAAHVH